MRRTLTMPRRARNRALALAVVAAALAVTAGAGLRLAPGVLSRDRTMCGELADAIGLYPGNKVKLLDVEVGTITSITNKPDFVQVDFTVPQDLELPEDEGLVTMSDSIVTDRHLELTKPYADGTRFDGSHCIGLQSARTPIGISESLSAISDLSDAILGGADGEDPAKAPGAAAINDSIKATARTLDGMGQPVKQSLQNLAAALGDPAQAEADLRLLLVNSQAVSAEEVQHWSAIASIFARLPQAAKTLSEMFGDLALFFERLHAFTPVLIDILERFAPRVYNLADKIVPWVSGAISWLAPQIIWIINQMAPVTQWLSVAYRPGWGAFDLDDAPSRGPAQPPMADALCDALRARDAPGVGTTCAPATHRADGVGLADLLAEAAGR